MLQPTKGRSALRLHAPSRGGTAALRPTIPQQPLLTDSLWRRAQPPQHTAESQPTPPTKKGEGATERERSGQVTGGGWSLYTI